MVPLVLAEGHPHLFVAAALEVLGKTSFGAFLAGPGRDEDDVILDEVFARGSLSAHLDDLVVDCSSASQDALLGDSIFWPIVATQGDYDFRLPRSTDDFHDPGVTVHDAQGHLVGLYTGMSLFVEDAHRGHGLGVSLTVLRFLRDSSLPQWEADKVGFSSAGWRTHYEAYKRLLDMRDAPMKVAS